MTDPLVHVQAVYPDITILEFIQHCEFQEAENGPELKRWTHPRHPRPTKQNLESVYEVAEEKILNTPKQISIPDQMSRIRARLRAIENTLENL